MTSRVSREPNRLLVLRDGWQLTPRGKYMQLCNIRGIRPVLHPLITGESSSFTMADENLGDADLLPLIPLLEELQLDAADLSGNRMLTDRSLVPLIRSLAQSAFLRRLCFRSVLGPSSAALLSELLLSRTAFNKLVALDVSEVPLHRKSFQALAEAIAHHPTMLEVNLANTGFAPYATDGKICMSWLMSCPRLQKLDLSWNCLDIPALQQLGQSLSKHRAPEKLSLAGCSGRSALSSDLPIEYFLELLSQNNTLKQLDLSLNHMDYRAALILEDALESGPLQTLDLSENPLGQVGVRSILRLLCSSQSKLRFIALRGCTAGAVQPGLDAKQIFSYVNPSGLYDLDLSRPYHRSLLRMLYKKCELSGQTFASAFQIQSTTTAYSHPDKKEGRYPMPQSGRLSTAFSLAWRDDGEDMWGYARAVYLNWTCRRFSPSVHKTAQLLYHWQLAQENPQEQLMILEVMAKDFMISSALLQEMCAGNPDMLKNILTRLMHCVSGGRSEKFLTMMRAPTVAIYLRLLEGVKKLLLFTPENPTGHYYLEMSNSADFALAEQILVLNQWEITIEERLAYADTSQFGNRCHLRNMTYAGRRLPVQDVKQWILPTSDAFAFDYVSCKRPSGNDSTLESSDFDKLLKSLSRMKNLSSEVRLRALRSVSTMLYLTSVQMRQLLTLFEEEYRARCAVIFFFRVVDMQNEKVFRCIFEDPEQLLSLRKSLGFLASFPYVQPDHWTVELDLSQHDQRRALHCLWTLAEHEKIEHLTHVVYTTGSGHVIQGSDFLVPRSWMTWETVPTSGKIKVTYTGGKDTRNWAYRKKLYEQYGLWKLDCNNSQVQWWASLTEAPAEVVKFLQMLVGRFSDFDQAFTFMDGGVKGNGVINLKELYERMRRMGIKSLKGPFCQKVFRFLDPNGSGSISREEWTELADLYKEVSMRLNEFALFLERQFPSSRGVLRKVWDLLDPEGVGSLSRSKFEKAVRNQLGFLGSTRIIVEFLDLDDTDSIDWQEMLQLERFMRDVRPQSARLVQPPTPPDGSASSRKPISRRKSALASL
ncbi:TONSL [Symbiodinium pilosum]|uniref:TONSL protein n=1 Tax=Symbiodinium pilosum TaxID=2952 RepID=A0A812XSI4_SYMPI|nr:TONSL [Symbiodinium pilosum]